MPFEVDTRKAQVTTSNMTDDTSETAQEVTKDRTTDEQGCKKMCCSCVPSLVFNQSDLLESMPSRDWYDMWLDHDLTYPEFEIG